MERIDVINRIIEAERSAAELVEDAKKSRDHAASNMDGELKKLGDEYERRAEARIRSIKEQEDAYREKELAAIERAKSDALSRLEKAFLENEDQWLEELFLKITGPDLC